MLSQTLLLQGNNNSKMSAITQLTSEEENICTEYGADRSVYQNSDSPDLDIFTTSVNSFSSYKSLERKSKTCLLIGASSSLWLIYLIAVGSATSAMPWVIVLIILMMSALTRWLALKEQLQFKFVPSLSSKPNWIAAAHLESEAEISTKLEYAVALTFAIIATILPAVLLTSFIILGIDISRKEKPLEIRQVVDIELVSPADAIDTGELLPATSKEITRQQKSARQTTVSKLLQGKELPAKKFLPERLLTEHLPAPVVAAEAPLNFKLHQPPATEPPNPKESSQISSVKREQPITFQAPSHWKTVVASNMKDNSMPFTEYSAAASQKAHASPKAMANYLSEVEPVNLIESIDNQGDVSGRIAQNGGRSKNGSGSSSNLHAYLLELNRRIRQNWLPPRGTNRIAIVEFRISATGNLLTTRPINGDSANKDAEIAAISAIQKTFPFEPLPNDVHGSFLDVRYTFSYRYNQIEEVSPRQ